MVTSWSSPWVRNSRTCLKCGMKDLSQLRKDFLFARHRDDYLRHVMKSNVEALLFNLILSGIVYVSIFQSMPSILWIVKGSCSK